MVLFFEILYIKSHHGEQYILARSLTGKLNVEIKDGATLGGIPIDNYIDMPRLLDENNQQRLDVFVFKPWRPSSLVNLVKGQLVELILP